MPEDIIKPNQPQTPPEPEDEKEPTESTQVSIETPTEHNTPESTQEQGQFSQTPEPTPVPPTPTSETEDTLPADNTANNALDTDANLPTNQNTQPPEPATKDPFAPDPAPVFTTQPKKRGSKLGLIIALIVIIVATCTALAIYISRSSDKETTKATTSNNTKKDIQNFRYAVPDGDLSKLYPFSTSSTSAQLNSQIFEGLVRYEQQTKIVPALATSWTNPDTNTWVFKLREGVKFHNGNPLTAEDVKYSLDYAVEHQNDENTVAYLASTISGVEVVNDNEVKITTDGPDPVLLSRLAYLYIIDNEAEVGSDAGGTGPYIIKPGTTPTETSIDLVAWDDYYGGHVYTRSISMYVVPSVSEMVNGINEGKYDFVGTLEENEIKGVKNYEKIEIQSLSIGFVGLNTQKPNSPLSHLEGRQAAAYALNTKKIIEAGGLSGTPSNQLIPSRVPGHDPSIKGYSQNIERAKELLARTPNANAPLKLSYGGADNKAHVTEIANQLKAVGFNVVLDEKANIDDLIDTAFSGNTDMYYAVYDSTTLDGYDFFSSIVHDNALYSNQEISNLIDESVSTLDQRKRLDILKEISRKVSEDIPVLPVYVPVDLFALRKPYHIQSDIPAAQAGIYFWKTYQK